MAMLSTIVLFISILLVSHSIVCSSQEFDNCDDAGNCNDLEEVTSCITQYSQLDSYVLNNKTILRTLTETFFKTGEGASQFVKFTYNFQLYNSSNSSSEDDFINCTNYQTTYVWSTSVLYLLGPRPLFWLTLFAVIVPEASAAIELPCFCTDAYADLLARFTYLSKVYAVMAYHDQPLQYINRYYFQTKTEGDDHYDVIYNIMTLMEALPSGLWIGLTMFAVIFIFPQVSTLLKKLSLAQSKEVEIYMKKLKKAANEDIVMEKLIESENKNGKQEVYLVEVKSTAYDQELLKMTKTNAYIERKVKDECKKYTILLDHSASNKWEIHEIPLLCLSILLNIALFAFHILSAIEIIKYANDVLQSHQQDSSKDHASSPITSVTFSFIIIVVTYISAVFIFAYKLHKVGFEIKSSEVTVAKPSKERPLNFRSLAAMSITVNIIHIVCYFMPYMLLAFIYNPLQTCVTYLALGLYLLCTYFLFWILIKRSIYTCYKKLLDSDSVKGNIIKRVSDIFIIPIVYYFLGYGILLGVIFFSAAIIYVLTLGSLNDFEVIQNLVPPLLIGLLTYFVIKPTYKQAKQKINPDDPSCIKHAKEDTSSTDQRTTNHHTLE